MKTPMASAAAMWLAVVGSWASGQTPPASPLPLLPADISGTWSGEINVQGQHLVIAIHFTAAASGGWGGTMDVPIQGARGLPLDAVTVSGDHVTFGVPKLSGNARFDGTLAGAKISGNYMQGPGTFKFSLEKGEAALKSVSRPQDPVGPLPYKVEEVTVAVKEGVTLAGTLTLPLGPGPFPAVVLVTGSGAQNRDEELLGHRPFLVLADRLTRAGIAVLRCDDRGVAKSTGVFDTATTTDFADDAQAGVQFLAARVEIKPKAIGLIGHSEGGIIGPMVAARDPQVAFVVMLAGPGVPGSDVMLKQYERSTQAAGVPAALIERQKPEQARVLAAAAAGDRDAVKAALTDLIIAQSGATTRNAMLEQQAASAAEAQLKRLTSAWMRQFLAYDPRDALRKVTVPVLALDGTLDTQVDSAQNLPEIEKALKQAGNKDATTMELPGLNHLFQHAKTGAAAEYAKISETMSEDVLSLVPSWINARFGDKTAPTPK